ncbi:MAG: hypothetical protein J7J89_03605 [Thermoplasmata archaeon]|nr:hypothetical protein [Thermoplasmata archaeon]
MFVNGKEEKIIEKIHEIIGLNKEVIQKKFYDNIKKFRDYKIKKILLISSSYDYFKLDEEGKLNPLLSEWASFVGEENPLSIVHLETGEECIERLKKEDFDLIIIFNKPTDTSIVELSKSVRNITNAPIALLSSDPSELSRIFKYNKEIISKAFTWNGDRNIIISIVHYFEDFINIQRASPTDFKRVILLIEDSIQHYSTCLSLLNEEIYKYLKAILNEKLSYEQKAIRFKRRPFVLHTDDFDEAIEFFEKYNKDLIFIITDNYIEKEYGRREIGKEIVKRAKEKNPNLPILIQSSEPVSREELKSEKIKFIKKNAPNLKVVLKKFIRKNLGQTEIKIKDSKGKDLRIKGIDEFEKVLKSLEDDIVFRYAKQNTFSEWLKSICEIELSSKCLSIENQAENPKSLKNQLINLLEDYNYSVNKSLISIFSRRYEEPSIKLYRIGEGALGGKARGLAFIAKLISEYGLDNIFPNLKITIPRSLVISTDIFDAFMENNNLYDLDFYNLPDHRIAAKFMKAELPATIIGDLRAFIKKTKKPLIVRSSGLLEDSLMQPFAGIYESVIFPNESWEEDVRFQEICNSIKYVYASTFFEKARTYIKNIPKNISDEKMAIIIQEAVGLKHENYFYPTISGVAKSYNYYPFPSCKPEDGIVYMALGLGKYIVEGGRSYAFCPEKPKISLYGTSKDYLKYSQVKYYALNLKPVYRFTNFDEEVALELLDIDVAKKQGILDKIASTYIPEDDKIYPGIYDNGYTVIDFAPIIKYEAIPLVKAIRLLLKISEIALRNPVEIEFAVNIPKEENNKAELFLLQIRSMMPLEKRIDIDIDKIPKEKTIVNGEISLGNGVVRGIKDIIYVDQNTFDLLNSTQVVNQIKNMNKKLMEENKPYILIGPGRWGSADPYLGIPVIWSDIAGVRVIVETPYKERHIDPSQGSHFFHDMMASNTLYLITKRIEDVNWEWLREQRVVEDTEFIKHVETQKALKTIVDGKISKGIIIIDE